MINAQEIRLLLSAEQKQRIATLFGRKRGLPWQQVDDGLRDYRLVHIRRPERGPATTELNNDGWSVAMLISDASR